MSENSCKHVFNTRVWQADNLYLQCSKCGFIKVCNHEWKVEFLGSGMINVRCVKCGIDALYYKCKKCNDYTPHWFVKIKGTWKWDYKTMGNLEMYKCLKCGNAKTIRRGRGEWSQSVLSA